MIKQEIQIPILQYSNELMASIFFQNKGIVVPLPSSVSKT